VRGQVPIVRHGQAALGLLFREQPHPERLPDVLKGGEAARPASEDEDSDEAVRCSFMIERSTRKVRRN
jgi:hypothetical protein